MIDTTKIKDEDWLLYLESKGIITAKEYDQLTDPSNPEHKANQELDMYKFSKHQLELKSGKIKVIDGVIEELKEKGKIK